MTESINTDQVESEYFVVYSDEVVNPDCRKIWQVYRDLKAGKGWPEKECFVTSCKEEKNCIFEAPRSFCPRINPTLKLSESLQFVQDYKVDPDAFWGEHDGEDEEKGCHFRYYQCVHDPCPELKRIPKYCVYIGRLTPEELIKFKALTCKIEELENGIRELSEARNADRYYVQSWKDIDKNCEGENCFDLSQSYEEKNIKNETGDKKDKQRFESNGGHVLSRCARYADAVRKASVKRGTRHPDTLNANPFAFFLYQKQAASGVGTSDNDIGMLDGYGHKNIERKTVVNPDSPAEIQSNLLPLHENNPSASKSKKQPGQPRKKLYDWLADKKKEYKERGQRRTIEQLAEEFNRLLAKDRADILGSLLNHPSRIEIPDDPKERKRWRDKIYSALRRR